MERAIVVHFSHGENKYVDEVTCVRPLGIVVGGWWGKIYPPPPPTLSLNVPVALAGTTKVSTRPTAPPAGEVTQESSSPIFARRPCACIICRRCWFVLSPFALSFWGVLNKGNPDIEEGSLYCVRLSQQPLAGIGFSGSTLAAINHQLSV